MLALGVCACDPGGDGASGATGIEAMCEARCEQQQECYPDAFQASFDSLSACRDACEQEATEFYDSYPQPDCIDEALAKDQCVSELSCAQLAAMDYQSCQDEFDTLELCLGHVDGGT